MLSSAASTSDTIPIEEPELTEIFARLTQPDRDVEKASEAKIASRLAEAIDPTADGGATRHPIERESLRPAKRQKIIRPSVLYILDSGRASPNAIRENLDEPPTGNLRDISPYVSLTVEIAPAAPTALAGEGIGSSAIPPSSKQRRRNANTGIVRRSRRLRGEPPEYLGLPPPQRKRRLAN